MCASPVKATCPYCQTHIEPGRPITSCPQCYLPYHPDCWQENGGCAAYGCPGGAAHRPTLPTRPVPPPATPEWPSFPVLTPTIRSTRSVLSAICEAIGGLGGLVGAVVGGIGGLQAGLIGCIPGALLGFLLGGAAGYIIVPLAILLLPTILGEAATAPDDTGSVIGLCLGMGLLIATALIRVPAPPPRR